MALRIQALTQTHKVFVACEGDVVVGWIDVGVVTHLQSGSYAEIGGLVVTDGHRGRGVGGALVAYAEAWASRQGLSKILVRSQIAREAAHRFYLREGYQRTKTSAVFTKGIPAIVN